MIFKMKVREIFGNNFKNKDFVLVRSKRHNKTVI